MSSLSTSLKNSYQRWLHPYEEYLKIAKPGVQQQLEFENGGPFTPTSANQTVRGSHQGTPTDIRDESPAMRASAALNASLSAMAKDGEDPLDAGTSTSAPEPPRPITSSGFTPVNSGGWTPVNLTPASFQAVNGHPPPHKRESENGFPGIHPPITGLAPPNNDLPDYLNTAPLTNGHSSNPLKRTISHDSINGTSGTDSGLGVEIDDQNERRSKRAKKGMQVSLLRQNHAKLPCSSNCSRIAHESTSSHNAKIGT